MATPGSTVAFSNLGTSGTQILAADVSRSEVTFHNPNTSTNASILVYQANDTSGNSLAPTFSAPGGGFLILPGGERTFRGGNVGLAWSAVASTGSTNGVTMWISSRGSP